MANTFVRADGKPQTTRTSIYTCPASTTGIAFAGTAANIDTTSKVQHKLTLEILKADAVTYVPILQEVAIDYGGSLKLPKIDLVASEQLIVTTDVNNMLQVSYAILQRT